MNQTILSLIFLFLTSVVGGFLSSRATADSPTWQAWKHAEDPPVHRVVQYLDFKSDAEQSLEKMSAKEKPLKKKPLVLIDGGRKQGVLLGTVFKTLRQGGNDRSLWVETGRLKAIEVQEDKTIAAVEVESSTLSQAMFPKFPGVMAGDFAVAQRLVVTRRHTILPTIAMPYHELFADPKAQPESFELTTQGYVKLKEAALAFADARVSLLMIEGYTDHNGPSQMNQVESYQRAMTVRQYLIDELGFDEQRVVAVGYGESEPATQSMAPGYVTMNRRIVFKAVPLGSQ